MKKKPVTKPRANRLSGGAAVAAALPLAIATILPAALNRTTVDGAATKTSTSTSQTTVAFQPGCKLPFETIKTVGLEVDATCSVDGNAGDNLGKRLEINAKNNFCAGGKPTPIVFDDFTNLEAASDKIPDLRKLLKTSRDRVANMITSAGGAPIGEGTLVQFVSFLFHADFSNVGKGKGEAVNCKLTQREDNDIHIQMMIDPDEDDSCKGVTAEMSPHFRPAAWSRLAKLELKRPIRITGPLFFDGSHHACHDDVRPTPNRISVWEIHPVYQFEVCKAKTLAACDVKTNSQWIPFDQWLSIDEENEP
jgi:hypothetical protein